MKSSYTLSVRLFWLDESGRFGFVVEERVDHQLLHDQAEVVPRSADPDQALNLALAALLDHALRVREGLLL